MSPTVSTRTFESLLQGAVQLIESHNAVVTVADQKVDLEAFRKGLAGLGGTTVEALELISEGDLTKLGVPVLIARQIQKQWAPSAARKSPRVTSFNRHEASLRDLVDAFDPIQPTSPAAEELNKRAKSQPFVVFDDSGGVHRAKTLECVQALADGETPYEHVTIAGRPHRVYRVGERPPIIFDEHPLHKGTPLRKDGTDAQGRNWREGITLPVRVLLHLAVHETHELTVRDEDHAFTILEMVRNATEEDIRQRYPKASQRYDELAAVGQLPSLRVVKEAGSTSGSGRTQDPFHGAATTHRTY